MRSTKTVTTLKCDICCQEITEEDNCDSLSVMLSGGDRDVSPAYVYYKLDRIDIPYGRSGMTDICKKCLIPRLKKWINENDK